MADKNTANIGFEKQIWDAACVLRGNLDASEYKSVVLGLIFLKYISDRFEDKYNQLVEEGDGFDKLIEARTGIHTMVAEDAISCVAEGTGKSLDSLNDMQDGTVNLSRRKQMN